MGPPTYIGGNGAGIGISPFSLFMLQWGHRLTSVETIITAIVTTFSCSFNGATDLHRWKPQLWLSQTELSHTLQWGHRLTSVETYKQLQEKEELTKASMGPPTYIGGNYRLGQRAELSYPMLQWGHRLTSVETRIGTKCMNLKSGLQWGHRLTSVETWIRKPRNRLNQRSFNGATDLHRWKRILLEVPGVLLSRASMGPPTYIGGNFDKSI